MTNRQKTVLWRWIISVIVVSRLLFLIPEYLPNILPQNLSNHSWISVQIESNTRITNLVITHQFIDPLILGLITLVIGKIFLLPNKNTSLASTVVIKFISIIGILPLCLKLSYLIFYTDFISSLISIINYMGSIFKYTIICISIITIFRFFIMGIQKYFQDDCENERLRIKYQSKQIND